jgi:hypothetical protein
MATTSTDSLITTQQSVHDFLTGRGWRLDGHTDPGDAGFFNDPDAGWSYPDSFGGISINDVDMTATPRVLQAYFTFDNAGDLTFAVLPAGNLGRTGCPEHDAKERQLPLTAEGTVDTSQLTTLLDELEPRARSLDPRALIECRFFGPCTEAP